jgi:hypothetical protein
MTSLEACHRLAPSEGQKENKWKTRRFPPKFKKVNRMVKISKQKLLLTTIILTILLISSAYMTFLPSAQATQPTEQQGIYLLNNIVGINLANYTVAAKEAMPSQQKSFMGVLPQDTIAYNLTSTSSKEYDLCTFINGSLQMIYRIQNQGIPCMTAAAAKTNDIDAANGFLSNYQTYTGNSLFGQLKSSLTNVDGKKNSTVTLGDKVLEATFWNDTSNFKWYYTANGATAPYSKFISIGVINGSLAYFINNWDLYSVGSNTVSLSKD